MIAFKKSHRGFINFNEAPARHARISRELIQFGTDSHGRDAWSAARCFAACALAALPAALSGRSERGFRARLDHAGFKLGYRYQLLQTVPASGALDLQKTISPDLSAVIATSPRRRS